jgi:hypothetical protein
MMNEMHLDFIALIDAIACETLFVRAQRGLLHMVSSTREV